MIRIALDVVDPSGRVEGWARGPEAGKPLELEFWLENEHIGTTRAEYFRRDLLEAGIGHGHYAFRCQLTAKKARHGKLEIREYGTGKVLFARAIEPAQKFIDTQASNKAVEFALGTPRHWGIADIQERLQALELETCLADVGPKRFVAYVYRFLLGRWPVGEEGDSLVTALNHGTMTVTDLFKTILNGDERKRTNVPPPSPYGPTFPFQSRRFVPSFGYRLPADSSWLAQAILVLPDQESAAEKLRYDDAAKRLACRPPAEGMMIGLVAEIPLAGPCTLAIQASVPERPPGTVEFAALLVPKQFAAAAAIEIFSAGTGAGFSGWRKLPAGGKRTLVSTADCGEGPADLYVATKGAALAAFFSDVAVIKG